MTVDPYQTAMGKWDIWELKIKFETEMFDEKKTWEKFYFTYGLLQCKSICFDLWHLKILFNIIAPLCIFNYFISI